MKRNILKCISTIEKLDVDLFNDAGCGVEIQDFVEPNLTKEEREHLVVSYQEKLKDLKGLKAIHGPFLDLKPSSPDPDIRRVSQLKYMETLQAAHRLDVDFVVFHSQLNPYLNQPALRDLNNRQAAEFWQWIMGNSPYRGKIVIENVFEESPFMIRELLDQIAHDRIMVNLDIGHINLGVSDMVRWIEILDQDIAYVHIHGNNGFHDQHRPPEDSVIRRLLEALASRDINPSFALEYDLDSLKEEVGRYRKFFKLNSKYLGYKFKE